VIDSSLKEFRRAVALAPGQVSEKLGESFVTGKGAAAHCDVRIAQSAQDP